MLSELRERDVTKLRDVESVIEAIKGLADLLDCVVIVGAADPEVSGILSAEGETFREVLPLGDGVHIVLSVGSLPTKFVDGIHEVEV